MGSLGSALTQKLVKKLAATLVAAAATHPTWVPNVNRYMPAATGIHWSQSFTQTYASGLNYQCSKLYFGSPDYPTSDFLIPYLGFGLTDGGNAPQETINGNTNIVLDEAWFLHPNGTEYPIKFGGNTGVTITFASGVAFGQTPVDMPPVPAWSIYGIRTIWHGAVGSTYIGGYRAQRHRGEKYWAAGDLASIQVLAAANGASTADRDPDARYNAVGNVSLSQPLAYGPAQIFAKGWDGRPVALILSDSLSERQEIAASADDRRNMGILSRWLDQRDATWGSTPHMFMGLPGAKSANELNTSALLRWNSFLDVVKTTYNAGLDAWTFVLDQSGRNDNNTVAATWLSAKTALPGTRVKNRYGAGTRIVGMTILPTVTSSDSGRTVAAYGLPDSRWDVVSGALKTVNDGIKASSVYSAVIDLQAAFMSDSDPSKPAAAENFPLGNVIGHPGNQDGVTNWDTIRLPNTVLLGARVMFEYQPATWASRTLIDKTDLGDGTANYKVAEVFPTNVQDNATLLGHAYTAADFIHPALYAILRTVSRIPQSEKSKFYA
ncbi:lysophospholipase L1-like esterase [Rhizobium phage RHEph06]|uniref:Uncharacterized protein n=2 Tax=Kleczkowskavirus RHEph4 TaxID=1921526 RepID=L7TMZ0_9CAUD|nr:lysophospholipase L1-like esterase [Rhizobium phage RHEph06]YP_009598455.1 lysophospholipase L1-like esterase [Rhizobium phage RHEph04]AGC35775.1 hypothetical protein RHEph05_gp008 [Rhizobium phage RHEph05]QXV74892.1 hypothetical protein [Rhizobium phage RHEph26]AGC35699.1 hypothetical protein RHEph04_gp013 [Rhizobium phage RHEph04]AGC35856.1 hypothetical protein RHEph06_gp014 [Rhizobium phage RHEph06]